MSKFLRGLNRRRFLQAAGLGAGAFFLPSLASSNDENMASARPRRIVFMMSELGWNPFEFRMKPPGAPDEVLHRSAYHPTYKDRPDELSWEIDLTRTAKEDYSFALEPLHEVREHALVLDGLGLLSIGLDGLGDAHARAWNHALSGFPAGEFITGQRALGGTASIDMRIARHLRAMDPNLTDLAAMHFYVNSAWWGGGVNTFHHYFYEEGPSGEIVKVPTESNPSRAFERLFPDGSLDTSSVSSAGRSKVLDALNSRYGAVFNNLSRDDREKLELHRQTIDDIQRRNAILENTVCAVPDMPVDPRDLDPDVAFEMNLESFFDLTSVAFSCDLTRVVCMQLSNAGGVRQSFYGAGDHDFHEWYSHGTNPPKRWRGVEGANVTEAEHNKFLDAAPVIANKNRYHVSQAVKLAKRLEAIPDGDGTLLDNTLIVLMDEISHGSHGHDQWPVVLIGGFGGAVRPGRYIRFPRTNPKPSFNGSGAFAGVPHSHLLVSICQAMGMPIDDLGVKSVYARHPGYAGQSVSLSGPLYALK